MTKASITLQDLRRRIYIKAKAEKTHRFWGLYVHVCKEETLLEAYKLAKTNGGAPGIDGITFTQIEEKGLDSFIEGIKQELAGNTYLSTRYRQTQIPKDGGKLRTLSIPTIKDRVVQAALKLILEPIFEADFQSGSYGYRPRRTPHQAIEKVATGTVRGKTKVIDLDIEGFFDNVRHHILFGQVAKRVNDSQIMRLLKLIVKAGGKKGIGQGSPISPLLANVYLNRVDEMLEAVKETTRNGENTQMEYARFADDMVVLTNNTDYGNKLAARLKANLEHELEKLELKLNREKTKIVDLEKGETFGFLGFDYRRVKTRRGKWGVSKTPSAKARKKLIGKLKGIFASHVSHPVAWVIEIINPILRGWANYFRIGQSSRCFSYIRLWVELKVRRHLRRAKGRKGFGWKRWSTAWMYQKLGLYSDYQIRYYQDLKAFANR